MSLVHAPQQQRSRDTREKLLCALEELLESRVFEQITIRDIAGRAQVAPGTIYRRFKDKDALLPILYERYQVKLATWADNFWSDFSLDDMTLAGRVTHVVFQHVIFYQENAAVLRTLHLHIRMHGELSFRDDGNRRRSAYRSILSPIFQSLTVAGLPEPNEHRIRMWVLILISTLNERMLFGDVNPAQALQMSDATFVAELTVALCHCLGS